MHLDCGNCVVRSWRPEDAAAIARYANNPNIACFVRDRFPHPYTLTDAEAFLAANTKRVPEVNFAIEVNGEAVGGIGLMLGTDIERVSSEIGYWLGEPFWGRGIATAALSAVTEHGFRAFDLTRIFALPFANNPASMRVLEKAGYTRDALLRRAIIKNGQVLDLYLYSQVR